MTWQTWQQVTGLTRGSTTVDCGTHVGQSGVDTCQFSLVEKGATWPNPGLPRGTPSLVGFGYKVMVSPGFEPATSRPVKDS
jgi:hypothetical protein